MCIAFTKELRRSHGRWAPRKGYPCRSSSQVRAHDLYVFLSLCILVFLILSTPACSRAGESPQTSRRALIISAIPDQDAERLQRLYGALAQYLSRELNVEVKYVPVTDYAASVTAFKVGDLDLVWYGGLTGTQARLLVPGAHALVQRDIDGAFHSVIIANKGRGIGSVGDLRGHTFTFGSESSTSGRLMPQYFLSKEGVAVTDFKGEPGFSGSHDKTVKLVAAGAYDAGALNEQVWKSYVAKNAPELAKVKVIWTTPPFHDYHWVIHPGVANRYGADFPSRIEQALLKLDLSVPEQKDVLDLFGAKKFVPTEDANYTEIEAIGRQLGLIVTTH
jgi:phosphonate transport system substrate-binding protein